MTEHINSAFDTGLKEVNKQIAKLGALAETQLDDSLTALKEKNIQKFESIIKPIFNIIHKCRKMNTSLECWKNFNRFTKNYCSGYLFILLPQVFKILKYFFLHFHLFWANDPTSSWIHGCIFSFKNFFFSFCWHWFNFIQLKFLFTNCF